MSYQIDQSGKIEQTQRHTVIACTNDISMTILLRKKEKRNLQSIFKLAGILKLFPYFTFAALVTLLLIQLKPKNKIIIDKEYFGHEKLIEDKISIYLEQLGVKRIVPIQFGHVGKLSLAHDLAYQVAVGRKKADIVVSVKDVIKVILGTKKDWDRLTQEWLPGDRRSTNPKKDYSIKIRRKAR